MKKLGMLGGIVLLAVAAVWNVVVFVLPHAYGAAFWLGYGFTMLALLLQIGAAFLAFGRERGGRMTFLGIPLLQTGLLYLGLQLVWGLLVTFVPVIPASAGTVVSVLLLAGFLTAAVSAHGAGGIVEAAEEQGRQKTAFLKGLAAEADGLAAGTGDPAWKKELRALADRVRYSDPVSGGGLAEIEGRIARDFAALKQAVAGGDREAAGALCRELEVLLDERGRICRLLK